MAEKTEERIYMVPLRDAWLAPRTRRAKKAALLVRKFLEKHMKSDNVKIGTSINDMLWTRGIQHPPRKVRIHVRRHEGIVYSELVGIDIKTPTAADEKKKKEKKAEKKQRIKEERKERKKMTLEKEIQEEKGAAEKQAEPVKQKSEMEEKK
ncbi:MAG: 50S ribosomal protein L31e [Candidatus Aenigmatarchaeota archaeon]